MGITSSCTTGSCGRCGKDEETKVPSRVNNSRQSYDYPNAPGSGFVEEPLGPDLFDAKKELQGLDSILANGGAVLNECDDLKSPLQDDTLETVTTNATTPATSPLNIEITISPESAVELSPPPPPLPPPAAPVCEDDPAASSDNAKRMWKKAAKKVLMAKNMGAKVALENKIGSKLDGWFRDVALALQQGVAAEGHRRLTVDSGFEAPQTELFERCRTACGFHRVRYFATMGLQEGLSEPNLSLIGDKDAAGKSGSFFFLSPDQQLIAKSCTKEDWTQLLRILPEYTDFLEAARTRATAKVQEQQGSRNSLQPETAGVRGFNETLLPRFLGLYSLQLPGKPNAEPVRVLVMANVFGGAMSIDRRYDLKGSTHGRVASKKECAKRAPCFKDIDWVAVEPELGLSVSNRRTLIEAIKLDLGFLAKFGLMDYSLLVGVHEIHQDAPSVYEAMNVVTVRDQTRHCYVGIIDVLTPYRFKKRAETFVLGTIVCGRDVSCQHPKVYADRFFRFMDTQVFGEIR